MHIYPLVLDRRLDRGAFRALLRASGVQTAIHYKPLHLTKAFARYARHPLPHTEEYARRTVTIPLFEGISELQQAHVTAAIDGAKRALLA